LPVGLWLCFFLVPFLEAEQLAIVASRMWDLWLMWVAPSDSGELYPTQSAWCDLRIGHSANGSFQLRFWSSVLGISRLYFCPLSSCLWLKGGQVGRRDVSATFFETWLPSS
jgi:hypothetical protein